MTDRLNDPEPLSPELERITQLARERFEPMSDRRSVEAFEGAVKRFEARPAISKRGRGLLWVAFAAVTILVAFAGSKLFYPRSGALAFEVEGADVQKEGYVRSSLGTRPTLHFSDGTRIVLSEHASIRIRSVDSRGAHFAVENGEIRAEVVKKPGGAWAFDAGPFAVEVKGTVFSLMWSSVDARLEVRLETGQLAIHTPFTPEPIALQGGQRLVATLSQERVVISALSSPDAGAVSNEPAPIADTAAPPLSSGAPAVSLSKPVQIKTARPSWAERFAAGDFRSILEDAKERGLDATLRERNVEELALLADAARYSGQTAIARRALLEERERFAASPRALDAAFLLGRLQEPSDPQGAIRWYDRYIQEAPSGTYTAEALGRKMLLVQRQRGVGAARPVAEEYLKRFPRGPHAQAAKILAAQSEVRP